MTMLMTRRRPGQDDDDKPKPPAAPPAAPPAPGDGAPRVGLALSGLMPPPTAALAPVVAPRVRPSMPTMERASAPDAPVYDDRRERRLQLLTGGAAVAGLAGALFGAPGLVQVAAGVGGASSRAHEDMIGQSRRQWEAYRAALARTEDTNREATNQERLARYQVESGDYDRASAREETERARVLDRAYQGGIRSEDRRNALSDAERTRTERLQDRTADNETWMERETAQQKWERDMAEWKAKNDRAQAEYEAALERQTSAFESRLPSRSGGGGRGRSASDPYAELTDAELAAAEAKAMGDGKYSQVGAIRRSRSLRGGRTGSPVADPSKVVTQVNAGKVRGYVAEISRREMSATQMERWLDANYQSGHITRADINEILRQSGY